RPKPKPIGRTSLGWSGKRSETPRARGHGNARTCGVKANRAPRGAARPGTPRRGGAAVAASAPPWTRAPPYKSKAAGTGAAIPTIQGYLYDAAAKDRE